MDTFHQISNMHLETPNPMSLLVISDDKVFLSIIKVLHSRSDVKPVHENIYLNVAEAVVFLKEMKGRYMKQELILLDMEYPIEKFMTLLSLMETFSPANCLRVFLAACETDDYIQNVMQHHGFIERAYTKPLTQEVYGEIQGVTAGALKN